MTSNALLSCCSISAEVDEKVILHDINLEIPQGEVHVLMGPNGAGKSTFGHVLMGDPVFKVTKGTIMFNDEDITELTTDIRSRKGLFLSFQAPVEIPGVPLRSFLRVAADMHGERMKNKVFRKRLQELAQMLDMNPDYLDRELGVGFSGGEKKKIEMLQLLLLQPKLAVLDETDSGLDVDALSVVSHGMQLYRESCAGTLLIITHNTRILEHLKVDCVHVMVAGHMVDEGSAALIDEIDAQGFERYESAILSSFGAQQDVYYEMPSVPQDIALSGNK